MDDLRALASRIFDGGPLPFGEWLGFPVARGVAILVGAAALAGWLWLFLRQRRMEAENESTREVLASALERERARGELVLGPRDRLAILRDFRRLAARLQGPDAGADGEDAGRREVSWGGMLADGRNFIEVAWWLITMPGLAIMASCLASNLLGDWLRDTLDPKRRLA